MEPFNNDTPADTVPHTTGRNRRGKFARIDEESIDEDYRIKIYRTGESKNWYVQLNMPQQGQKRASLKTRNKAEAMRRANEYLVKLRSGELIRPRTHSSTVVEAVAKYLESRRKKRLRPGSLADYQRSLAQFALFCQRKRVRLLAHVSPDLLADFDTVLRNEGITLAACNGRRGRPASPNSDGTVFEKMKLVKSVMKWAKKNRLLMDNPVDQYELPADGDAVSYAFTADEVAAICGACEPFFADVFKFLAVTGLRIGEAIYLTKDDISFSDRLIRIRRKCMSEDGVDWRPKGEERDVPMCALSVEIAERIRNTDSGWLFSAPPGTNVRDQRLRYYRVSAQLAKAKKKAGVKRGTLHSFRHHFITTLANQGVPAFQLMRIVGHKSLETLLGYYKPCNEDLVRATSAVDFGYRESQEEAI